MADTGVVVTLTIEVRIRRDFTATVVLPLDISDAELRLVKEKLDAVLVRKPA